jgi:hypothetical protein
MVRATGRFGDSTTTSLPLFLGAGRFSFALESLLDNDGVFVVESESFKVYSLGDMESLLFEDDFFLLVFISCFTGLVGADVTLDLAYL